MLTFSSKGKVYVKRLGGKARVKKISSLPRESPSHSPSTLCLRSDLFRFSPRFIAFFYSPLPLSASLSHSSPLSSDLASDSSLSPVSLPSVLGVTSSENFQRKPGQMANLGPATLTCPDSRAADALRPSLSRRAAAVTTTSTNLPHGGVGCFWQTTANVPQGGVGWFSEGKRDCNAARFATHRGRRDIHHLWRRAYTTTTTNFPHGGVVVLANHS